MNHKLESRLTALRSKTDRQLAALIISKLDSGLRHGRLAAFACPAAAARAYDEAVTLLPWVGEIGALERARLESRLENLRELLDESTIHAEMPVASACS
jgi:hypothetical protein